MSQNHTQKIGVLTATIVGMNAMIGAGIFTVPAALASFVGPAGILTYGFVILAVWFMGLSMARLAQLYPEEGSFYVYASKWGGHVMGLLSAGAYLIGLIIAMGLLSQVAGSYLHAAFPALSSYTLGFITLFALVLLNIIGVHLSQLGQMILIACTVFPLLAIIVLCFSKAQFAYLFPFLPYGLGNVFAATKAVIFGFFGFECAASLFNIVEHPEKNVPRALMYAIALVGLLYMLFVTSIILAVPLSSFTNPEMPISEALAPLFPNNPWLIYIIHFSILSAVIGTVHSMIWSSSNLLISYLKQIHHAYRMSNGISVAVIGFCIFLTFSTLRSPDLFFSLTALFIVFAFITSMITLLTIRKEWQSGQNIKTIVGLLTAIVILIFAFQGLLIELGKIIF